MKSSTKKWIEFATADLKAAEFMFNEGKKMFHGNLIVVFHLHQAIEKMLKAVLCEQGKEQPKIHNLVRLLGLTKLDTPAKISFAIADLNPHYASPRYPDLPFQPKFSFTYNRRNTEKILKDTQRTYLWLKKQIS